MGLPGGWGIKTKQNFIGLQHKTARPNFATQYEPDKYRSTLTNPPPPISFMKTNQLLLHSGPTVWSAIFSLVNLNT